MQKTGIWTAMVIGIGAAALLPRCSCEGGEDIQRAAVEMRLTLVEVDPCSALALPKRIPDDYAANTQPSTDLGSRAERVFEVRSVGSAPLKVSEIALSAEDAEYTLEVLDQNDMPATLPVDLPASVIATAPPGLKIKVGYTSADSEPDLVQLLIKTDDPKRNDIKVNLAAGRGRLEVCGTNGCVPDAAINFGNIARGGSDTKELLIKNVGEGDLDLRDLRLESASTEFCAPEATALPDGVTDCQTLNLCRVLHPGEEYKINIRYSPVDGGLDTGILRIVSGDAARGTVDVPINGTGAGPAICACVVDGADCRNASSVDFGAVAVGATERRTVRLTSCGTDPADLTEALLETDANNPFRTGPEFSISVPFTTGMLAPGAFAEGEISYTPPGPGDHHGGLRFTQAPDRKSWIALLGKAATCDLEALPTMVNFGTVAAGTSSDRNVALVNNGARDCTVTAISDPANGFEHVNKPALPLTVASGQSVSLTLRYTAPARTQPQGDMSSFDVTSDEPATPTNTVQLVAQGGGTPVCSVDVQPSGNSLIQSRQGQLTFGATNIGYTKTLAIRIANTGNTDCVLQSLNLTTSAPMEFSMVPSAPLPAVIGPGTTGTIDVTFAPRGPANNPFGFYGPLSNYVDFSLSGPGLTMTNWSIGINARPTVPTIDIIPDALDFGVITWDRPRAPDNRSSCGSEEREVRIYNSGTGNLDITAMRIDATSDPVFLITGVTNNGNPVNAPYNMTIAPGANATVRLRFFPTRIMPAVHTGLLIIENNVTTESTVPLRGEGTSNASQTDVFNQLADNKVDILWVVDDSGSMSEEQTSLANNFQGFINYADTLGVDYQTGVITTEINDAPAGKLWACNGFNKIIRHTDANRVQAFQCAANVTTPPNGNRRPNPMGSDEAEAGLQAARLALDAPIRDTDNAGFLRDDARLAVIIVSDEEDQSPGATSLYVDFFRNVKGFRNPQLVSVNGIVGDVPNGCATAEAGVRYHDAIGQLNGQTESVCSSSWATLLQNIGLGVFALRSSWTLSRTADPSTITVRVNGMSVPANGTNGWTFDPNGNAITFNGSSVPPPNARIEIQYGALCIP